MRIQNLGFREAVEELAKQAGVDLPSEPVQARQEAERRTSLHEICGAAADLFEAHLWSERGTEALGYLRNRGLADQVIRQFRLGWASATGNSLRETLLKRFPEHLLVAAGLIRDGERGSYDFFRGRVMFPIFDRSNRVIAFGGRVIGAGEPKYLNSPETEIFNKGRTLFALNVARKAVTKEAAPIVVEGYMDVITLHAAGFTTAVAPLGTALTDDQLAELWRVSDRPVMCFDGDPAGMRAAARTLDRALPILTPQKTLSFVSLEGGEDPDSLIRAYGRAAFEQALSRGIETSEFLWQVATKGVRPQTAERLAAVRHFLEQKIRSIQDRNVQRSYDTILISRLWQIYRETRPQDRKISRSEFGAKTGTAVIKDLNVRLTRNKICTLIVATAINHPYLLEFDIDKFAELRPQMQNFVKLHQDILDIISADSNIGGDDLLESLWDKHSKTLYLIFNSALYRSFLTSHPHADIREARLGWEALFNRLFVLTLRQELDDLARSLTDGQTDGELERRLGQFHIDLEAYLYHSGEEHLIGRERDRVPIGRAWRPPKKATNADQSTDAETAAA
jgi:DNA primase